MADAESIRKLVQDAIDRGATTVEEVSQKVAEMPLERLKGIEQLSGPAESAQELTSKSIAAVADAIRAVNEKVAEIAQQILGNDDSDDADAEEE